MADFSAKLEEQHNNMMATLEQLDVNDIKMNGVTLRMGNQVFQLVASLSEPFDVEEQIKKEYQEKLTLKLSKIGDQIKSKMAEVSIMVSSYKEEYDRKEKILKDTMAKSAPMPNVTWAHAQRGLSVIKGDERGKIIWLVKRVYNPKFVDRNPIEPLYIKKLRNDIFVAIITADDKVVGVSTRRMDGLEYFDHYHQIRPDCWGNWTWPKTFSSPEDIIKIADDAMGVLENVNTMSIAHRTPRGLPALATLRRHIIMDPSQAPVTPTRTRTVAVDTTVDTDTWG